MSKELKKKAVNNTKGCKTSQRLQVMDEDNRRMLAELYTKYYNKIYAYIISLKIRKSVAESLAQDVFLQLCYDFANGRKINHNKGYLFGLARNIVHGYRRGLNQLPTMSLSEVLENLIILSTSNPRDAVQIEDESSKSISLEVLNKIITELPGKYRKVLELRYTQNLPVSLAAEHAGCSKNTFYQRVHRAIKMIKAKLNSS